MQQPLTQLNEATKNYSRQYNAITHCCVIVTILYIYIHFFTYQASLDVTMVPQCTYTHLRVSQATVTSAHYNVGCDLLPYIPPCKEVFNRYISTPVINLLPYIKAPHLITSPILQPRMEIVVYISYIYTHVIHRKKQLIFTDICTYTEFRSTESNQNTLRNPNLNPDPNTLNHIPNPKNLILKP